jgi:hypothetical protein
MLNNSSTRSGITNQMSCNKKITKRNRQQMQTVNDMTRQWNISSQHTQYWQQNDT